MEDTCCGPAGSKGCQTFAWIVYMIVFPATYLLLLFLEYESYGWGRFISRCMNKGYNLTDFNQPTPAPVEADDANPPPGRANLIWGFLKKHPVSFLLPLTGLGLGIFGNLVPGAFGLILMPLFEEIEITKSSEETLALACMAQVVNSGLFGFFAWCTRDVNLFICRALFTLTPFAWGGYLVGVTNNLTFKDLLISVDKEVDDPGFRDEI